MMFDGEKFFYLSILLQIFTKNRITVSYYFQQKFTDSNEYDFEKNKIEDVCDLNVAFK